MSDKALISAHSALRASRIGLHGKPAASFARGGSYRLRLRAVGTIGFASAMYPATWRDTGNDAIYPILAAPPRQMKREREGNADRSKKCTSAQSSYFRRHCAGRNAFLKNCRPVSHSRSIFAYQPGRVIRLILLILLILLIGLIGLIGLVRLIRLIRHFGLSGISAFRHFGISAFRHFGISAFR
ncbi:hypothetical protein PQR53_38815, partial [Paraburkholderia fungorum]|uniref:hypothetical protein n=1 Tax=Paraburkholderia fungorum TaxID=134537 RepID=UPI0038BBD71D